MVNPLVVDEQAKVALVLIQPRVRHLPRLFGGTVPDICICIWLFICIVIIFVFVFVFLFVLYLYLYITRPYSMLANRLDTLGSVTRRIVSISSTAERRIDSDSGSGGRSVHLLGKLDKQWRRGTGFQQE